MAGAAQKAYSLIRKRILDGAYPPSLRLTEQEVAVATGVSRTPVREALRRLHSEGLVDLAANHGAVVVDWSGQDLDEVFELRALLESWGVARAAERIGPEGLGQLRALAQQQYRESEARTAGYVDRIGALNSRFHGTLHSFADSPRLSALLPMLIEPPLVRQTISRYERDELLRSAAHHLEIVSALEAGDGHWAAAIMRSHVHAAHNSVMRHRGQAVRSSRSPAAPST
jgi:DNA-binding GntR family transcriptional regulator